MSSLPPLHIALFPCAGMGHLTPFLRLAAKLSSYHCLVTLITAKPTVSVAESTHISDFLATHPQINSLELQILSLESTIDDPFFRQFDAIARSVHLLSPSLASASPPLSAVLSDLPVASNMSEILSHLNIPNYVVVTSSAKFISLASYLPTLLSDPNHSEGSADNVEIPGLSPLPRETIPPPLSNPNNFFTVFLLSGVRSMLKARGIIFNTFDCFEPQTLEALNNGRIVNDLPPVIPIGPLQPYSIEKDCSNFLPWLDIQPAKSVIYVNFGSRTAMSVDQIGELAKGLKRSNVRFLWVLKTSKVDKDDKEEIHSLLDRSFFENTKSRGMVVKDWVSQEVILEHPAIGLFLSHCGWNSVTEAATRGIPVMAWPLHGDQRVNAEVVMEAGLGTVDRSWGWLGQRLVKCEEIAMRIEELMGDEKLKSSARMVGERARKAIQHDGSSGNSMKRFFEALKQ